MLKHIVMWKLKEFAEGKTKAENALIMKENLERLVGIVPEIISLQVGINEKEIVFQKVCKFQFIYFCNRTVKNNLLWNLHLSK